MKGSSFCAMASVMASSTSFLGMRDLPGVPTEKLMTPSGTSFCVERELARGEECTRRLLQQQEEGGGREIHCRLRLGRRRTVWLNPAIGAGIFVENGFLSSSLSASVPRRWGGGP